MTESMNAEDARDAHAPREGTFERWAFDYVTTNDLARKLTPPPAPRALAWESAPIERRIAGPGRPRSLVVVHRATKKNKTTHVEALRDPKKRAELLHAFFHHELQAAELMCWALLAFPRAPTALRRGLLAICADEIRHMKMYGDHLESIGHPFGEFEVVDWFWERVPQARCAADFMATMGMGFEGGNLDHAARFAARFRAAGDAKGAAMQERVAEEEVPHVRFAIHWFRELSRRADSHADIRAPHITGGLAFDDWRERLPEPLSPRVMRGRPMNARDRVRAGFDDEFLLRLEQWGDATRGS